MPLGSDRNAILMTVCVLVEVVPTATWSGEGFLLEFKLRIDQSMSSSDPSSEASDTITPTRQEPSIFSQFTHG